MLNKASPDGGGYDSKDIRRPNHTAVSHIAVEASPPDLSIQLAHY
jgi:hypothetical protein